MAANLDLYYYSGVDQGFLKQRPHQLVAQWSRTPGVAAHFVEPPRRPSWPPRLPAPAGTLRSAFYLPFERFGLGPLEGLNRFFMARALPPGRRSPRVAIVGSCFFEPYVPRAHFDLICYDFLDALEVHATGTELAPMTTRHERLLAKSDLIFVTADRLRDEVARADREAVIVSNGVDEAHFQAHRLPLAPDARPSERPVVGYVGAIFRWVDLGLVCRAAAAMPGVDFVLVGPLGPEAAADLSGRPANVHVLGPRDYMDVPRYIEAFDVAMIPFHGDSIAASTDPIKLYEYFALGKPVVATPMRQLARHADAELLAMADTDEAFIAAIVGYLAGDAPERRTARMAVAAANGWASKADVMLHHIQARLAERPAR